MGKIICFCCSLLVLSVVGAEQEDYSSYLQLQESDPGRNSSSFTRGNWGADKEVAKAGANYIVPAGMTMHAPATTATFPGDALAIAGTLIAGNTGGYWNYFKELILLPGGAYKHNSNNSLDADDIVIFGTAENPSVFSWSIQEGKYVTYTGKFKGSEDAVMRFNRGSLTEADRDMALSTTTYMDTDFSGYFGRLVLGVGMHMRMATKNTDCEATGINHTYPGTVELMKDSILTSSIINSGTNILGGLTLDPGSELQFYAHGVTGQYIGYAVTNEFSASGDFRIGFRYDRSNAFGFDYAKLGHNGSIPLIHLTGPAAETDAVFSESSITNLIITNRVGNLPSNVRLGLVGNEDGSKDVSVKWDPVIVMNVVNASNGSSSPMAFSDGECWSTGVVPDEDFSGHAVIDSSSLGLCSWLDTVRTNMILTVKAGATVYHQAPLFSLKELHMVGGSQIMSYAGQAVHRLCGRLVIWPAASPVNLSGWSGYGLDISSEISGSGGILVKNHNPSSFTVELRGTNVNYSGTFTLTSHSEAWDPAAGVDGCTTLYLNDGRNLGGPYSGEAAWKALTVKDHSKIEVRGDVTLDEPTRGVYVENAARFIVPEGATFAVNQNITFAGELEKLGAGTLSLGGTALFIDGNSSTAPLAGTNRLVVGEGALKVTSTNAVDGVAVEFAAGTALELDAVPSKDGMADYGMVNVKWDAPFVAAGKVGVSFADDGRDLPDRFTTAVCTVRSSAAGSLPFSVVGRLRAGFYTTLSVRDNGDGSVTLLAEHQRMGSRIILR